MVRGSGVGSSVSFGMITAAASGIILDISKLTYSSVRNRSGLRFDHRGLSVLGSGGSGRAPEF